MNRSAAGSASMRKHRKKGTTSGGAVALATPRVQQLHTLASAAPCQHGSAAGPPCAVPAGILGPGDNGTDIMAGMSIRDKQTTALRAIYCTLLQGVDYYYTKSQQQQHHHHTNHHNHQQQPRHHNQHQHNPHHHHHQHHSHHSHHHQHHQHTHQLQQHPSLHPLHHHQEGQIQQLLVQHLAQGAAVSLPVWSNGSNGTANAVAVAPAKQASAAAEVHHMSRQHHQLHVTSPSSSSPSSPSHPSPSLSPSSLSSVSSSSSSFSSYSSSSRGSSSCGLPKDCKTPTPVTSSATQPQVKTMSRRPAPLSVRVEARGPKVTTPRPPARPWLTLGTPTRNKPSCLFTVMSYNILCDQYASRQTFGYCPSWALAWEYRRKTIMDEVKNYSPDIVCMQELGTEQFYSFFLPELARDGYDGIFSPKSRAKTMSENDRKRVDGVAIFYRKRKFSLVKKHLVEFNQMAMSNAEGCDDMLNRVMTKDNIGLAALLQTKEGAFDETNPPPDANQVNQPILVCTSHLHWDPEYCDVKLIQTMMLMHELRTMLEDSVTSFRPGATKADPNSVPLLFCCDLNSTPESGVIEFLSTGRVAADHPDFKGLGYQDCLKRLSSSESSSSTASGKSPEFTHPFKIASTYADGSIPFTNFSFDFKGVLDYVFYSKTRMSVMGILGPLDMSWLQEYKVPGFPHPHVPSDHLPLLVELELTA